MQRHPVRGSALGLALTGWVPGAEIYTNGDMLELETFGPFSTMTPGASGEHIERWRLFRARAGEDDAAVEATLGPLGRQTKPVTP